LIWFLEGDEILPAKVRNIIADLDNDILVSIAALWEIAIKKTSLYRTLFDITDKLSEDRINILPIEVPGILHLLNMTFYHKDPFDSVITAQFLTENLILISNEQLFDNYVL